MTVPRRALNDELRRHLLGGGALASPKLATLDHRTLQSIVERLARFDEFLSYGSLHNHDFGAFDFEGATIVFTIDCQAQDRRDPSPNDSNELQQELIITLMFAEEYALLAKPL